MTCPRCNKSSTIAIGSKHYCGNCGDRVGAEVKAVKSLDMTRPIAGNQTSAVRNTPVAPTTTRRPTPAVVSPMPSARLMRDIGGLSRTSTVSTQDPTAKPAAEFHAKLKPARGGVLDLREVAPKKKTKSVLKPVPKSSVVSSPVKHTAVPARSMHSPVTSLAQRPIETTTVRRRQIEGRLTSSALVPRSTAIKRFNSAVPAVPKTIQAAPVVKPSYDLELPAHTASQHEHLSRLIDAMHSEKPGSPRLATRPSRASYAASAAAIAIISGYVWMHNYPQMALSSAADKAGFSASLPAFIPSSYNLKGSPNYAPGLVTLDFASPSFKDPLKVTQQPTGWDSRSLLDNYVAVRTPNYASVNGQGLTIFLLNGSQQATWINHGIWYSVEGAANLSRDQLLKMAYSF